MSNLYLYAYVDLLIYTTFVWLPYILIADGKLI